MVRQVRDLPIAEMSSQSDKICEDSEFKGKVSRGLPRAQHENAVESLQGVRLVYAAKTVDRRAGVPSA